MIITYLPIVLGLLLSITAFIFVCFWRRRRGQILMLAFVTIGLILPQLINLLLKINSYLSMNWFQQYQQISTIHWLCQLISNGLLLAYIANLALAKTKPNTNDSLHTDDVSNHNAPDLLPVTGPQWNVPPNPKLNVKILRQREWGFLIDFMPFIFAIFLTILIEGTRLNSQGFFHNSLDYLLPHILWLTVVLQFPYGLFKDCVGGRSLGKYLTGCRVVDSKTGKPALVGQTILRNLPFLIPLFSIVELATASIRPDSRRLGDLLAGTIVVTGSPDFFDGEPVAKPILSKPVEKHPLDD